MTKFKVGDLLRIKHPKVTKKGYTRITNKFTGIPNRLVYFDIEGLSGYHCFGTVLARKKFVYVGPSSSNLVCLYDNYKPEYLGKGYRIICKDINIFKKVGEVIDTRELPLEIQKQIEDTIKNNYISFKETMNLHGMTRLEKIKLYNSSPKLIQHQDPGIAYALLMAKNKSCRECGTSLTSTSIDILHADRLKIDELKDYIHEFTGTRHEKIHIFPAGYLCKYCSRLTVFIHYHYIPNKSDNRYTFQFENFLIGPATKYIKKKNE